VPLAGAVSVPLQRAEKLSAFTPVPGEPLPQSKSTASTRLNAEANGVRLNAGLPEAAKGHYDTVLANILATPLKVLAPLLRSHVRAGGSLVLAGILERQADELKEAYAPYAALEVSDTEDGWILMTARC